MHQPGNILYLTNKEIDRQKWDDCIVNAGNRLIYPRSFYLDNMAPGWNALVGAEYDWVFPVTPKKKFAITYLTQPPLSQQLGAFARPNVEVPFKDILEWLQRHYRFWEINSNYATDPGLITAPVGCRSGSNFVLDLSVGYESIAANYHNDLIKNLKRSKRSRLRYRVSHDYYKAIELFISYYGGRLKNIKSADYKNFGKVCAYATSNKTLLCREIVDCKNELLSIVLVIAEGNRLYNLMNVTTNEGRSAQANHFLLDQIIREYAGHDLIFDFEGSDVPGIKNFYQNFGAVNQPFYQLKYNNLPWPLKLLKE